MKKKLVDVPGRPIATPLLTAVTERGNLGLHINTPELDRYQCIDRNKTTEKDQSKGRYCLLGRFTDRVSGDDILLQSSVFQ